MSMKPIKTLKVVNKDADDGWCLINECDFNDKEHKKFVEAKSQKPKKPPKETTE